MARSLFPFFLPSEKTGPQEALPERKQKADPSNWYGLLNSLILSFTARLSLHLQVGWLPGRQVEARLVSPRSEVNRGRTHSCWQLRPPLPNHQLPQPTPTPRHHPPTLSSPLSASRSNPTCPLLRYRPSSHQITLSCLQSVSKFCLMPHLRCHPAPMQLWWPARRPQERTRVSE